MEIRYECMCYERTLVIKFPKGYEHLIEEILMCLDQYYDEWINFEEFDPDLQYVCLEEYMMDRLSEIYNMWEEWDVEED